MIKVSKVSEKVQPSLTRKLFNMAKAYNDVIDFTLGDPDVQTHQAIKDAGCAAIQQGKTRYSQNAGLIELRQTISEYYNRTDNISVDPQSEIIVTVGAMEGLFLSLLSILDPLDEVIIPAPYYVNYVQMVSLCHGVPVIVDNPNAEELSFSISDIEKAITPRTKAIIINTPSNPSGKIIASNKIKAIAEIAQRHNLVVISDEVYKCLIYDDFKFSSIVNIDGMRERTILINSLSKEFCMTGWRIGYVIAPKEVIATMTKLQENVCACAPLPSQYAAIEALSGNGRYSENMVNIFTNRRNVLFNGISKIDGLRCSIPEATFYLMVDISSTGMSSEEFAVALLQEEHVAVVPGIAYGNSCDKYIRIAFTLEEEKIREGINRINRFMNNIKK
ncbi:pyridoxal phosphate-dependent aminotransferase [uncultured Muribaculum sp.]|jgi:aminotransferase|uniref:pyridoxal phosphate-dependent aminotransferase n=3 Tax=uncultured Muribaculum sp. TaxID=1918613 RepID=UPI00258575C0|nr:pyridoxal phosphate-dependent aminotransferase [uncultured Muribaculum sp.]